MKKRGFNKKQNSNLGLNHSSLYYLYIILLRYYQKPRARLVRKDQHNYYTKVLLTNLIYSSQSHHRRAFSQYQYCCKSVDRFREYRITIRYLFNIIARAITLWRDQFGNFSLFEIWCNAIRGLGHQSGAGLLSISVGGDL